jgi:hypothetical protein
MKDQGNEKVNPLQKFLDKRKGAQNVKMNKKYMTI